MSLSKRFLSIPLLLIITLISISEGEVNQPPGDLYTDPGTGIGNPAAIYCLEMGYEHEIVEGDSGQEGFCKLPGDESCPEWDFLNGKCGQSHSFCARQGFTQATIRDGKDPFSQEYAVCLAPDGKQVGSLFDLMDLDVRTTGCAGEIPGEPPTRMGVTGPDYAPAPDAAPPASFDWRDYDSSNWLTPVKNQGGCGSCWAFSAVGVAEAAHNIGTNDPTLDLDLSEQYLVSDCHNLWGYQTCCGGWKDIALDYISAVGIPDESCMSYVDGSSCSCGGGTCDSNCTYRTPGDCSDRTCSDRCGDWSSRLVNITSTGYVGTNPTTIKQALVDNGPLAVSVGIGSSFGGYFDGEIYRCTSDTGTNHAVAIVGYDDSGGYWWVRNSWGPGWNDAGYYKVGYGECYIERYVYYALAVPEIDLTGNSQSIPDGDTNPSLTDHTDFGSVNVIGSTVTRTFTIENSGTANLNLTGPTKVVISGTHAGDFNVTSQPISPVDPGGGTTTFQVEFDPASSGLRQATISIANNDSDENPYTFAIQGTGTGLAPEINLLGNSLTILDGDTTPSLTDHTDFGSISVSSGTMNRTFTIENSGTADLSLTDSPKVNISGPNAGDFNVTIQPTSPVASGGASTTFQVEFDPSSSGLRQATINIANNDSDENPYEFDIQGTGTIPEMDLQGNGLSISDGDTSPTLADHTDFGDINISGGSITRTYTIENTGTESLILSGIPKVTLSGAHSGDFNISSQPTSPVASGGGTTTVQVEFNPSGTGLRQATIIIANNDSDENPYTFAIQGTGTEPEMDLQGNGQAIPDGDTTPSLTDHTDFGDSSVLGGTVTRTFTIENTGSADLALTDSPKVVLSGAQAGDFNVTSQPTSPVSSGGTTTFQVEFDPDSSGLRQATISIANNDSDENPYTFDIQGTGIEPEIDLQGNGQSILNGDLSPSLSDHTSFGSTNVSWGMETRTFTIENTGTEALVFSGSPKVTLGGAQASDFTITSQPASPVAAEGGTTTFQVEFNPTDAGIRVATVSITNNDSDENPYTFSIQGTGSITFPDVLPSHWSFDWVEALAAAGLTSGYPDGTYRPENQVTRAEMAIFLLKGNGITPPAADGSHPFSDIAGHWAEIFIEELYDQGISGGYPDGTYRPENQVTRAEMAVFLLKGIGISPPPPDGSHPFPDVTGHWAEIFIEELYDQGISGGYPNGTYQPENLVTRAEMAVFLVNTFGIAMP